MKPKKQNKKFSAIDLFSGAGGLTLGLKQAGFNVIGAIEIDKLASETYGVNHPEVRMWEENITKLEPADVMAELGLNPGELSLMAGCPPCQGFSSMRTLNRPNAVDDPRNDLIFDFYRFIEAMQPETVMMENVPGLATDSRFSEFVSDLGKIGYTVSSKVFDTSKFGVPQRRRRLILLASKTGVIGFAAESQEIFTVRQAISGLPPAGNSGDPLHDIVEKRTEKVAELIRLIPQDGGGRVDLPDDMQLECHKRCGGFKDVYGRLWWDRVSSTITSGCFNPSKGRFLHPEENRTITLREAALLQSFPKDYYFSLAHGKTGAGRMIGNALPPEFIKRHACNIRNHIIGN